MSFTERWFNTIYSIYDWYNRNFVHLPLEEEFARKHFAHLAPLPSISQLMKNISVTLINTHRAFDPPRPSLPSKFKIK